MAEGTCRASLTVCPTSRRGTHDWRRTYSGRRFDVLRCRSCGLQVTEKDGVRQ